MFDDDFQTVTIFKSILPPNWCEVFATDNCNDDEYFRSILEPKVSNKKLKVKIVLMKIFPMMLITN